MNSTFTHLYICASCRSMPHPLEHSSAARLLGEDEAVDLAESMSVFATASRLRILYAILSGERSVEELAAVTKLPVNTVSQQLRVLRTMHFVRVRRDGRRAIYSLHDSHLIDLLGAIRHHAEHVHRSWAASATENREMEGVT